MSAPSKKPFIGGLVEGLIDPKVYQDILKTHAREAICFPKFGHLSITNVDQKTISRMQFTECEISPFRQQEFACQTDSQPASTRTPSTHQFSSKPLSFKDLQTFLIHSFSPNETGHRPYPSAGGLYPVEPLVFIFKERISDLPEMKPGCYHYRPVSQSLQLLKTMTKEQLYHKILHGFVPIEQAPAICIAYIAHIGKAIFKYRYRGYRHALMEAGSMYQQAGITARQMGMHNTAWSTFSDHELLHDLGLDHGSYAALTMQLFGFGESS